jgi:hypothetical protein
MDAGVKTTLLSLLKLDLGITHALRDVYFNGLLDTSESEIARMGASLDLTKADDQILLVDYAAWSYRKRLENVPLARSIQFRIHNRLIQKAGAADAES